MAKKPEIGHQSDTTSDNKFYTHINWLTCTTALIINREDVITIVWFYRWIHWGLKDKYSVDQVNKYDGYNRHSNSKYLKIKSAILF